MTQHVMDTVQLFVDSGVNANFAVTEELAFINSLCTTSGEYIFKEIEKTRIYYYMKWNLLSKYFVENI